MRAQSPTAFAFSVAAGERAALARNSGTSAQAGGEAPREAVPVEDDALEGGELRQLGGLLWELGAWADLHAGQTSPV